ncbi:MAG: CoA-binding protein [Candidatus Aenigmarchaeota archaeon]|nr:CoA-binding protein [Candidatus Aenigmarchaeota archaeon]
MKQLDYFFNPKSVAIIGASHKPGKIGYAILANFLGAGFKRKIYPVNPDTTPILGLKVYKSVLDIKDDLDLVIIVIPAESVPDVLRQCVKKRIESIIIISAGFSEIGEEGKKLEIKCKKIIEGTHARIIGPNCVSGSTGLLVRRKNPGTIEYVNIGDFVEHMLSKYSGYVRKTEDSVTLPSNILKDEDRIKVLSWDGNRIVFKDVVGILKKFNSIFYRVTVEGGRELCCTPEHPFLIKREDSLRKVECKDLSVGDLIPCCFEIDRDQAVNCINLLEEINRLPEKIKSELRVRYKDKSYDIQQFEKQSSEINLKDCFLTTKHGMVKVPLLFPITEEFCEILGLFIADGNYKSNQLVIGYIKEPEVEKKVRKDIDRVFVSRPNYRRKDLSKRKEIKFGGKLGKIFLKHILKIGDSAETKQIPAFIFNAKKRMIGSFLSSLFTGDGRVSYNKKRKRTTLFYYTVSKKLADQLQFLFNILGVGPFYVKKLDRKQMKIKNVQRSKITPLYEIRTDSTQALRKLSSIGFHFLDNRSSELSKFILRCSKKFKSRIKEPVFFRRVKKIERIPERGIAYDFEVADTHNLVFGQIIASNCIGVYDPYTHVDTLFLSRERCGRPKEGNIAFITQSGAVGSTILDWMSEEGIGISKFISYGNAMDVDDCDLLEYLADDDKTDVITVYLEGIEASGQKFMKIVKKVTKKKPVIILKAGRTEKGLRAVFSHTGSLGGSHKIYSAAFKQTGVIEANSWEELFDFARGFSTQSLPKENRIAIITDGGGFGVLATDEAEKQGLQLPEPSEKLKKEISKVMPPYATFHNPIDLTGDANANRYKVVIESCLKSNEFDGVIAITLFQVPTLEKEVVDHIVQLHKKYKKPLLVCAAGGKFTRELSRRLNEGNVPVYPTPERAIKTMAALVKYREWLKK